MPRIPTYQQKRLPQPTPGVRVSPESMTKDIGAMAGFGQAMVGVSELGFKFAAKLKEAEIESQVNLSMGLYKKGLEEFRRNHAISKETDWPKTEKDLGKIQSELDKNTGSILIQPAAKAEYDRQKQGFNLIYGKALFNSTNTNRVSLILEQTKVAADLAIEQRDPVSLRKVYSNAAGSEAMDKEVAETKLKLGLLEIEEKIEKDIYEAVWNQAKIAPTKELANDIIRAANLSPNQEKELLRGSSLYYADKEAKVKQDEIDIADKWVTDALKKLRDKKFTFDDVLSTPKGMNREHWASVLNRQNDAILKGKPDPFEERNDAVYERISERIDISPERIDKEKDIWALHGKGLPTKDVEFLLNKLKRNLKDPLKTGLAVRFRSRLAYYRDSGLLATTKRKNQEIFLTKARELDAFFMQDVPPTPKEAEDFFVNVLTKEAKSEYIKKAIDALIGIFRKEDEMMEEIPEPDISAETREEILKNQPEVTSEMMEALGPQKIPPVKNIEDLKHKYGIE